MWELCGQFCDIAFECNFCLHLTDSAEKIVRGLSK